MLTDREIVFLLGFVVVFVVCGWVAFRRMDWTALQGALIAAAVAIGAASVVFVMVQVYRGDELGRAIPWIEQAGVAIVGISAGSFALCVICLIADLIDRLRKRLG